ncbi:hypothetical protein SteCoe_14782 [Stentor coeruleus]|uniref:Uncharacterized protein n=1 Tax=Stentor coeruleus TaxID=5963 RepID=A0A1R2C572_9CILI|nr:hypothetical protein SteCoe_14782 [Stentor coeruleus]
MSSHISSVRKLRSNTKVLEVGTLRPPGRLISERNHKRLYSDVQSLQKMSTARAILKKLVTINKPQIPKFYTTTDSKNNKYQGLKVSTVSIASLHFGEYSPIALSETIIEKNLNTDNKKLDTTIVELIKILNN